jgi:hypothetical protein
MSFTKNVIPRVSHRIRANLVPLDLKIYKIMFHEILLIFIALLETLIKISFGKIDICSIGYFK